MTTSPIHPSCSRTCWSIPSLDTARTQRRANTQESKQMAAIHTHFWRPYESCEPRAFHARTGLASFFSSSVAPPPALVGSESCSDLAVLLGDETNDLGKAIVR